MWTGPLSTVGSTDASIVHHVLPRFYWLLCQPCIHLPRLLRLRILLPESLCCCCRYTLATTWTIWGLSLAPLAVASAMLRTLIVSLVTKAASKATLHFVIIPPSSEHTPLRPHPLTHHPPHTHRGTLSVAHKSRFDAFVGTYLPTCPPPLWLGQAVHALLLHGEQGYTA